MTMPQTNWLHCIKQFEKRTFSQRGQDGVIEYVFKHIGPVNDGYYVEFGFNTTNLFGGSGANVAALYERGWRGLLLDGTRQNRKINLHREFLTPKNLIDVFHKYDVPASPDYVSIDVDSLDLWLFDAMLAGGIRPRVVSVEYNINYPLSRAITVPNDASMVWKPRDRMYGASLRALHMVAVAHGYVLVHVVSPLDAFFVRGDLLAGQSALPLQTYRELTGRPHHRPCTQGRANLAVDYTAWRETGDVRVAQAAAKDMHPLLMQSSSS